MIRIAKEAVVDGVTYQISAEGGSAKEALSIVDAAAEELGAAPAGAAPRAPGARGRRSKAEMEAARAAAAGVTPIEQHIEATPASPPLPGPMPPAAPAHVFGPPSGSEFATQPTVVWADAPVVPQVGKTVGFDGPPPPPPEAPPPKSVEETLREEIDATMARTIAMKPEWREAVVRAMHTAAAAHGGDIFHMGEVGLRHVVTATLAYEHRVKAAIGAQ